MNTKHMKVLNLYAGIGGNRKLWHDDIYVSAVERDSEVAEIYQDLYPNDEVIVGDAHQYLIDNYQKYDFIWTSPPCQSHSVTNHFLNAQGVIRYPQMELLKVEKQIGRMNGKKSELGHTQAKGLSLIHISEPTRPY